MGAMKYRVRITAGIQVPSGETIQVTTFGYKPTGHAQEDDRAASLSGCNKASRFWDGAPGPFYLVHSVRGKLFDNSRVVKLERGVGVVPDTIYEEPAYGYLRKRSGRWVLDRTGC